MDKTTNLPTPRVVDDQALEVTPSGPVPVMQQSDGKDVLLLHDVPEHLSYRAIHNLVKPFGDVVRIKVVHDDDLPSNRCYIGFATARAAASALHIVGNLDLPDVRAKVISSRNLEASERFRTYR